MKSRSELETMLGRSVSSQYGEPFEFRPRSKPTVNSRSQADPNRSILTITATYALASKDLNELGRGGGRTFQEAPEVSSSVPTIRANRSEFTDGEEPVRGDRFVRVATGEIFEVTNRDPLGRTRWRFEVAYVGSAE